MHRTELRKLCSTDNMRMSNQSKDHGHHLQLNEYNVQGDGFGDLDNLDGEDMDEAEDDEAEEIVVPDG
jgi:hypothetical protein